MDDPWRDQAWRARMVRRFGAEVEAWCDDVPRLAGELAVRWRLGELEPVPAGGTPRVVACRTADGGRAFLKLPRSLALPSTRRRRCVRGRSAGARRR